MRGSCMLLLAMCIVHTVASSPLYTSQDKREETAELKSDEQILSEIYNYVGEDSFQKLSEVLPKVDLQELVLSTVRKNSEELVTGEANESVEAQSEASPQEAEDNPRQLESNGTKAEVNDGHPAFALNLPKDFVPFVKDSQLTDKNPEANIESAEGSFDPKTYNSTAGKTKDKENADIYSKNYEDGPDILFKATFDPNATTIAENVSVEAALFPWWKKKEDDCDDADDWPKKVSLIEVRLNSVEPEPGLIKDTPLPPPEVVFNQSSIIDWIKGFIEGCKEEDDTRGSVIISDEDGELIYITFSNNDLSEAEVKAKVLDAKGIAENVNASQNLIAISFDSSVESPKDTVSASSDTDRVHRVHASTTLRELIAQLQRENNVLEIEEQKNEYESTGSGNFTIVSWDNRKQIPVKSAGLGSSVRNRRIQNAQQNKSRETHFMQETRPQPKTSLREGMGKHSFFHKPSALHKGGIDYQNFTSSANSRWRPESGVAAIVCFILCAFLL